MAKQLTVPPAVALAAGMPWPVLPPAGLPCPGLPRVQEARWWELVQWPRSQAEQRPLRRR